MPIDVSGVVSGLQAFVGYAVDSSGNPYMNVDGSSTPIQYSLIVPQGFHLGLTYINLLLCFPVLEVPDVSMNEFAHLDKLANGVKFEVLVGGNLLDATAGYHWKTNSDLLTLSSADVPLTVSQLDGDASLVYHYPMTPSLATHAVEFLGGDFLRYTIQDDLSTLHSFRITLFGVLLPDSEA